MKRLKQLANLQCRLAPALRVLIFCFVTCQVAACSSSTPPNPKTGAEAAKDEQRNNNSTARDSDEDDGNVGGANPQEGARSLSCPDSQPLCKDQYYFLVDAFETGKVLNASVPDHDAATAYSLKLNGLRKDDRLYFTTTVRLDNLDATTTQAIARLKIKNGSSLSEQVESLSSSLGQVTLATAAMSDVAESGEQSYLLQTEATGGGLRVEKDAGSLIAMVYRRLPLREALAGTVDGYFFRGFQKVGKTASASLPADATSHAVLSKEVPMQKGDLVVATSILSWKSLQSEGDANSNCDGLGLTTSISVAGTDLSKPTKRVLSADSRDATLRASHVWRASDSGSFTFALNAKTDATSACQIHVEGHGGLFLYIYRPLKHLNESFGQAYALFNSGIVNMEEKVVQTSGDAGKVTTILKKEIGLATKDIIFYETFANIGAEESESATTTLLQHKRSKGEKVSSISRAMLAAERNQATLYGADAYYAEADGNETIEVNVSGANAAREDFKVENVKFIYHQFRLIPKPAKN